MYQVTTQEASSQEFGSNRPYGEFESAQCQNRTGEEGRTVDCGLNLNVWLLLALKQCHINENWHPDRFAGGGQKKQNTKPWS